MSGLIHLDKANVVWLSPLLKGYVNQLDGRISGTVSLNGNTDQLNTEGQLQLLQVKVRPEVLEIGPGSVQCTILKTHIRAVNIRQAFHSKVTDG